MTVVARPGRRVSQSFGLYRCPSRSELKQVTLKQTEDVQITVDQHQGGSREEHRVDGIRSAAADEHAKRVSAARGVSFGRPAPGGGGADKQELDAAPDVGKRGRCIPRFGCDRLLPGVGPDRREGKVNEKGK